MKVLHVISDQNVGGAGILLLNLLACMDRTRVQSIVAMPKGSALYERVKALDIPVVPIKERCDRPYPRAVRELSRIIRAHSVDVVHANAAIAARMAGKRCGVAVVHTRHCFYPVSRALRVPIVRWAVGKWNQSLSDCAIATAEAAAANLRALGFSNQKIKVIINGSLPVRAVTREELDECRQRWGIDEADFTVGICARLEPCKGHETFLQAAKLFCNYYPHVPVRFLIVGDGSLRATLEARCQALELSDQVVFTGFVRDMAPVYRLLRLNVNCSQGTETSCLALSEGMSAGVPFAASDYGGNRAMVGDGRAGFLFPCGDAFALSNIFARLATDPQLEQTMRTCAVQRFEAYYTAEQMSREVTELYETVLREKC